MIAVSLRRFAVVALALIAGRALAGDIQAVRFWDADDHTRVVFDVNGPVNYKLFTLANPDRLVLDIAKSRVAKSLDGAPLEGAVKRVRTGRQGTDTLRVVLDLDRTIQPKSFLLKPADQFGHRLVIDLFDVESAPRVVKREASLPVAQGERDVIVSIDAGHGGDDPGALGANGSREKDITLAVAKVLADRIDAEPGMTAVLTRDRDFFIPLNRRYEIAREQKADLFISIHADAFVKSQARGSSVFVLSNRGATSEAARMLADRENSSDLVGGVSIDDKDATLAAVLLDLSQGATMQASEVVANNVLRGLASIGNLHKREVQRANFVVLRSPDVPSMLVETAFISNPAEEKRLNDPAHREKLANALVHGVRDYFATTPPPGTWFAANPQRARHHVVARGESLSLIAQRHRVSVASLKRENALATDTVHAGVVLKIPAAI
jgi:N-acetylmuramoyl-L-alanine amidase